MEYSIRRKVLVVDDEPVNRSLLGFIVGSDYEVIYAENGIQALKIINENKSVLSLILLDLLMPELDGYELLEILREDEELRHIPVIVLTSERSAEVKSLQLGAVDFIPKPYDMPEVILARVRRSIELAEDHTIIRAAETDALTGLYTKDFFYQYARQHDKYFAGVKMDALVLNISRFHLLNELYGRTVGNEVLKVTADTVKQFISKLDGLACRCDADNFYLYMTHSNDSELYKTIIDTCAANVKEKLGIDKVNYRLGVYAEADMTLDMEQRFDRANLACTKRLNSYSNSLVHYDTQLHEKELFDEKLISEMDRALSEKQFVVYYQPKYNIKGDKPTLSSAEALIRWQHPELGMVSPGAFVPLFEKNGLIQKLDRYVWEEAAAQISKWKKEFGRTVPVSVNVSRLDIYDSGLEERLLGIVEKNQLQPGEYLLEITESAYTDNSTQIIDTVNKLRADGFRVEMDDFGSGYSSLNMLAAMPIDALKLDMKFIRNITDSDKDLKMVELIIGIASYLEVPVIAEGVETAKQYQLLKKIGCDVIQGYYFSKPVPPEEFNKLIIKDNN